MYQFLFKYYRYLLILLLLYLLLTFVRNIFNIYTFIIFIIFIFVFYNKNKRIFKKIIYKLIFKRKGSYSFRNKYGAAKNSLEVIGEFNKKITNQVEAELLKYEKNKLEAQLKNGDYMLSLRK